MIHLVIATKFRDWAVLSGLMNNTHTVLNAKSIGLIQRNMRKGLPAQSAFPYIDLIPKDKT